MVVQEQRSLTQEQKVAFFLLSIGTFFEYFDLMLYVHMAVLLNDLFFPKTDLHVAALISAGAFCSTYLFRPLGALIFGWIGDNIGRKATVTITTFLTSMSCIVIANLPTYTQIGVTAAWIVTICRIIQGMSSMGEMVGAKLYLTETTKPPIQYLSVALIDAGAAVGATVALAIASIVTSYGLNWRIVFWIGAGVALIGIIAKTNLRETPEFVEAKCKIKGTYEKCRQQPKLMDDNVIVKEKVNKKTILALFLMDCGWPVFFYFAYIQCSNLLKSSFGYNAEQVIYHNLIVSIIHLLHMLLLAYLSYRIYPLVILKIKLVIFCIFILFCPYLLDHVISNSFHLALLQIFILLFAPIKTPAIPIFFQHFPVFQRCTYVSFSCAISRAIMSIITSFGIVYLTEYFGYWGLLIIMVPIIIGYMFGLRHFVELDIKAGNYSQKQKATLCNVKSLL